jgi:hypothetical protein
MIGLKDEIILFLEGLVLLGTIRSVSPDRAASIYLLQQYRTIGFHPRTIGLAEFDSL